MILIVILMMSFSYMSMWADQNAVRKTQRWMEEGGGKEVCDLREMPIKTVQLGLGVWEPFLEQRMDVRWMSLTDLSPWEPE